MFRVPIDVPYNMNLFKILSNLLFIHFYFIRDSIITLLHYHTHS